MRDYININVALIYMLALNFFNRAPKADLNKIGFVEPRKSFGGGSLPLRCSFVTTLYPLCTKLVPSLVRPFQIIGQLHRGWAGVGTCRISVRLPDISAIFIVLLRMSDIIGHGRWAEISLFNRKGTQRTNGHNEKAVSY